MTTTDPNQALNAAVRLFGPERGHRMLGCDWGTKVALPDDREVCIQQARQRTMLHGPNGEEHLLKLCPEHARVIDAQTDPHVEAAR